MGTGNLARAPALRSLSGPILSGEVLAHCSRYHSQHAYTSLRPRCSSIVGIGTQRRTNSAVETCARRSRGGSFRLLRSAASRYQPRRNISSGTPSVALTVQLSHRGLVLVAGRDASQFLQGLTTNNIPFDAPTQATSDELPLALCAGFLNAQGRILEDVLIYTLPTSSAIIQSVLPEGHEAAASNTPSYLIELDRIRAAGFLKILRRFKLRSKIVLRDVDAEQLGITFRSRSTDLAGESSFLEMVQDQGLYCARDERAPGFGFRLIAPPSQLSKIDLGPLATVDDYRVHRYRNGIPEGQAELPPEHSLVHESNLDLMAGVDFRKGCYVGQELVIRTQHTGIVRKRILPVMLYASGAPPPERLHYNGNTYPAISFGTEIKRVGETDDVGRRNRSAGKWIANVGDVGLALVRLEPMAGLGPMGETVEGWQAPEFGVDTGNSEAENPRVKAFVPAWWSRRKSS